MYTASKNKYSPLAVILAYLIMTIVIYNFGPVDWASKNQNLVNLFLMFNWVALALGYYFAIRVGGVSRGDISESIVLFGFICNAITIAPTIYMYTGKWPWDAALYVMSQGERYNDYQNYLSSLAGGGGAGKILQVLARATLQPFIYGGIILGVKYWYRLSWLKRSCIVLSVLLQVLFSVARGTDKEIIDLAILILVPYFLFGSPFRKGSIKRYALIFVMLALVVSIFSERRLSRYGGEPPECFSYAEICVDSDSEVASKIPASAYFSLSILSAYLTQGYNGISLAMDLDYAFSYGIGHAAVLMRLLERFTGIDVFSNTYTYRLGEVGWDSRYLWSSMYTWYANDVSFNFVFVLFVVLGLIFGYSAKDALLGGNDYALIVLTLVILALVYSPANYQLAVSIDMYLSWLFWFAMWAIRRVVRV